MTSNAICVWDLTIKSNGVDEKVMKEEKKWINRFMKEECKKWAYQLEKGEKTGYIHYQCRFSLNVKKRAGTLIKTLEEYKIKGHLTPTSNTNRTNLFYVMKEETRIDGPWTDMDTAEERIYIPRQVRNMRTMRPFQQSIIDSCKDYDERTINIIVDTRGNTGKSKIKNFMRANGLAFIIPPSNDYKEFLGFVCSMWLQKGKPRKDICFIIDIPRALDKKHLRQFYGAIETLKDGYAYDSRYKATEATFDSPTIWVFTNEKPNVKLLSIDRWRIWRISSKYKLKDVETGVEFDHIRKERLKILDAEKEIEELQDKEVIDEEDVNKIKQNIIKIKEIKGEHIYDVVTSNKNLHVENIVNTDI